MVGAMSAKLRSFRRAGERGYRSAGAFSRVLTEHLPGPGVPRCRKQAPELLCPRLAAQRSGYEAAEDRPRKKKLEAGRQTPRAMPATVVKELFPTWADRRHDMLEIGHRRREPAERRGVKEAAPHNEHAKGSNTASNLEPAVGDVFVREAIRRQVQ